MRNFVVIALAILATIAVKAVGAGCPRQIVFEKSLQTLGNTRTMNIATGDVDLDGDIDLFLPNYIGPSSLWLNDGDGTFSLSPQSFPLSQVHDAAIADFNGDNHPDIFVLSHASPSRVFFGNGDGSFTMGSQQIGGATDDPGVVVVGDVDHDGDLDAFISYYSIPNRLWLNDGNGQFTVTSTLYGGGNGNDMQLADLNGDSFVDLFITFTDHPDEVWMNDGHGAFINSGQLLGNSTGYESTAHGDVDGDGDIDLAVANSDEGIKVFFNQNNSGVFVESTPYFQPGTPKLGLVDADSDGDLDVIAAHRPDGNYLWVNDGSNNFTSAGELFGSTWTVAIQCPDLDGDGDSDVLLGHIENSGGNEIYFNESVDTCTAPLDGRGGGVISFNSDRDGNQEVYVMNADGSGQRNITNNPANDGFGSWSPDGMSIAFVSDRDGAFGVWLMDVEDLLSASFGPPRKIADKRPSSRVCWSPDGEQLIFDAWPECDIYTVNADGSNLFRLTNTPEQEFQPCYSPDGDKVAFCLTSASTQNIAVMNSDGTGTHNITADGVSYFPSWSPDGTLIAFNSRRSGHQDVDICATDTSGSNRVWLTDFSNLDEFPSWSPDANRITYQSDRSPHQIFIVNSDGSGNVSITDNTTYQNGEPCWRQVIPNDSACCAGMRGNVDDDALNLIDIGDLTALIGYLFIPPYAEPVCMEEANVDGIAPVDIGDLTALIGFLFIPPFTQPVSC